MAKRTKIMSVFPDIYDIQLNTELLLYPITFKKMGYDGAFITDKSHLTRSAGMPRIIEPTVKQPKTDRLEGPFSYIDYISKEIAYGRELSRIIKAEKPNAILFYRDPIALAVVKISNPEVKTFFKVDFDGVISDLPYPKFVVNLSLFFKYKFSDVMAVAGEPARKRLVKFAPYLGKKLRYIPNPIPEKFFVKGAAKREKVIFDVARIARVKGHEVLLNAFAKIAQGHPDWKVRIAGPIEDKQYYKELVKLAKDLRISDKVKFLGMITDKQLISELRHASIYCLASFREGAAATRVEAMASGLPVVTTMTGGSELVDDAGFVVDVGDMDGLAKALSRLMENPEMRKRAGSRARTIARGMSAEKSARKVLTSLGL